MAISRLGPLLLLLLPVVAQQNARQKRVIDRSEQSGAALPSVTFGLERTIKLGGVTVQLLYFGPAHTDADTVVYFLDLKVVAVGDFYTRATLEVDHNAGGDLLGWATAPGRVLQLDFDKVVPGSGPVVDRAELQAFKSRIDAAAQPGVDAELPARLSGEQNSLRRRSATRSCGVVE